MSPTDAVPSTSYMPTVSSSVLYVAHLARSVDFYSRIMHCTPTVTNHNAALLLTGGGFQLYIVEVGSKTLHILDGIGNGGLMWSVETADELAAVEAVMKAEGCYVDTHTDDGMTFVQGRDPDHLRVIVATPPPSARPRTSIAPRFYRSSAI
jgi:catechol 2,3-dioxygenase-like lactoylglutathione lyase family enzyme